MNINNLRSIVADAPKGSTHIDFKGAYLRYDLNKELELYHVNYKQWYWASNYICPNQSLADIKTIIKLTDKLAELEYDYNNLMESSYS